MNEVPALVLSRWAALAGRPSRRHGTGLIQDTFLVEGRAGPALVQRLHPIFGAEVHQDILAVTRHLAGQGMPTPRLLPSDDGALCVEYSHPERPLWRAMTFLEDTVAHDRMPSPTLAREAGALVGRFHHALRAFVYDYRFVRPGVHDTRRHLAALRGALERHPGHRLFPQVEPLARELLAREPGLPSWDALPLRHAHGDLKLSNLLFRASGEGLCLVDLDTVGLLPWPLELADALRSWCNPLGEDTAETVFSEAIFEASVEGYAREARGLVTPEERGMLVEALVTICLELSARFLADALEERYFGWKPALFPTLGEHNLVRARGQWALLQAVERRRGALEATVRRSR
ncbi:MAG: phosphotransferase [Deltaproteobacteria bacterium]|nr:phosphotransferase [Deltaproteobacteria bacterium]